MGSVTPGGRRAGKDRRLVREPWYGASPAWQLYLERNLWLQHAGHVRREEGIGITWRSRGGWLAYHHDGLWVPGRHDPVPVTVAFFEMPPYSCFSLKPEDYPRVWADCGAQSKHRMGDDALCLYYPRSPRDERWTAEDGLLALLNLIRDHLFFEDQWRRTGGRHRGIWLGNEAPHGFPIRRAS